MIHDSINDKSLEKSLWILKNISKIRFFIKFVLASLIFIEGSIFVFNIVEMSQSYNQYENLYGNFLKESSQRYSYFSEYLKENAPVELNISKQGFTQGFSKLYSDFYAFVSNPNEKYKLSSFDYYFVYNGDQKTKTKTEYMPINSEKYIFVRGLETANVQVENAKLVLENLKWSLVDLNPKRSNRYINTKIPYDCNIQQNLLTVEDEKISNSKDGSLSVNVFSFKLVNNSFNNYRIVNNKIVFFDKSGNVVYVLEKNIENIKSKNNVVVSLNLPSYLQDFGSVLVLPEVDMCQEDSYMDKEIINTGV